MVSYFLKLLHNYKRERRIKTEIKIFEKILIIILVLNLLVFKFLDIQNVSGQLESLKSSLASQEQLLQDPAMAADLLPKLEGLYRQLQPIFPVTTSFQKLDSEIQHIFQKTQELYPLLVSINAQDFVKNPNFTKLNQILEDVNGLNFHVQNLAQVLTDFDQAEVPIGIRQDFQELKQKFLSLSQQINFMVSNSQMLAEFSGLKSTHRYLLVIQNDAEIRPLGGFTGLFALVDVSGGKVQQFRVLDIYELDGQYLPHLNPPHNLQNLNPKLFLRDLNFSSNPYAYHKLLQKELASIKFPSFDTLIICNQSLFKDLIPSLGPLSFPNSNLALTSQNYFYALTMLIEAQKDQRHDDKILVKELLAKIVDQVQQTKNTNNLLAIAIQHLRAENIRIITSNPDYQQVLQKLKLSQEYKFYSNRNQESFQLTLSSIGGNKTDLDMQSEIYHTTFLTKNQKPRHQVQLIRKHGYSQDLEIYIDSMARKLNLYPISKALRHILIKGDNKVVAKLHLPLGASIDSVLVDSKPVKYTHSTEIHTQSKVVFVELNTKPYQDSKLELNYSSGYKLQKDGVINYQFHHLQTPGLLQGKYYKSFHYQDLTPERLFINQQNSFQNQQALQHGGKTDFRLILSD